MSRNLSRSFLRSCLPKAILTARDLVTWKMHEHLAEPFRRWQVTVRKQAAKKLMSPYPRQLNR